MSFTGRVLSLGLIGSKRAEVEIFKLRPWGYNVVALKVTADVLMGNIKVGDIVEVNGIKSKIVIAKCANWRFPILFALCFAAIAFFYLATHSHYSWQFIAGAMLVPLGWVFVFGGKYLALKRYLKRSV
jgi:hypothetical protein